MAYLPKRKPDAKTEDRLVSDNTQKESTLGAVFSNVDDSSSLVEREKSVLETSFFKKEKMEEFVSVESENNLPAPIV